LLGVALLRAYGVVRVCGYDFVKTL
jgi:hypothetical protein